jgi:hypothetical protein
MADQPTISKQPSSAPARNFRLLREEGLQHIQLLSRKVWTDYNIHDPGITSLELLSYAITDLAYRIGQPLPDLLALPENEEATEPSFPTAAQVLPGRPVTVEDYRRMLIDIPGIRNAWLLPVSSRYAINCERSRLEFEQKNKPQQKGWIEITGLYQVLLELDEDIAPADTERRVQLKQQAWQLLQANRNLCEDFTGIKLVQQRKFCLCAEIELTPEAEIDLTEARIFRAVQQFLTPPVKTYALEQQLDKGVPVESIFEGRMPRLWPRPWPFPFLSNGFLDVDELADSQIRQRINLSDILQVMMKVDGVQAVRDIIIAPSGAPLPEVEDSWTIPVWKDGEEALQPVISVDSSRLVFYKDILPFRANSARVETLLAEMGAGEQVAAHSSSEDLPIPGGRYRKTSSYSSIQQHYPRCYGINGSGLPDSATTERKAQARQLQAYLLFFDQVLANYFAQLGNVRQLFSLDPTIGQSYFTQVVEGVRESDTIYADSTSLATDIQNLTESNAIFLERRNKFLDHLLARFAENFNEYVWTMYAHDRSNASAEAARAKREFLREYPELSANRGGAFNYSLAKELWNTDNISGLSRRIGRLLDIRNVKRRNLAKLRLDIYDERDADEVKEYRFRIRDDRPEAVGKILLSSSWKFYDTREARREMHRVLGYALDRRNYQLRITRDERFYFNLTDEAGDILARRIEYFKTEAERDAAIDHLLDLLRDRFSDEGLFLVEHLLLRPRGEVTTMSEAEQQALFLPICTGGDCSGVKYIDPYSCRITFVLPAWPTRFADLDFRRFVEKTIRQETPAHILPKICWVDRKQLATFERVYQRWLKVTFASLSGDKQQVLTEMVEALSHLRSVYPEATLAPCDFILDRAVLGRRDG